MCAQGFRVYLEIRDPFSLSVPLIRRTLGVSTEDSALLSIEQNPETQTCRFVVSGRAWPPEGVGETEAAVRFRDLWQDPAFFHATQWLAAKSPSTFETLADDMDAYFVVRGYYGTIPRPFLQQIVRLGIDLAVLAE